MSLCMGSALFQMPSALLSGTWPGPTAKLPDKAHSLAPPCDVTLLWHVSHVCRTVTCNMLAGECNVLQGSQRPRGI